MHGPFFALPVTVGDSLSGLMWRHWSAGRNVLKLALLRG